MKFRLSRECDRFFVTQYFWVFHVAYKSSYLGVLMGVVWVGVLYAKIVKARAQTQSHITSSKYRT